MSQKLTCEGLVMAVQSNSGREFLPMSQELTCEGLVMAVWEFLPMSQELTCEGLVMAVPSNSVLGVLTHVSETHLCR